MSRWPTAVDLFCGSGAVTEALKARHFKVVAAVDNDPVACATYRINHPTVELFENDIKKVDPKAIKQLLGRRALDLLIVCAPCQPFSSQNRKREGDARASLILQAARFAAVLKPKLILFENVPGLASENNQELLKRLKKMLGDKYKLSDPLRLDAADYEVPQRRVRCIMMAGRNSKPPKLPDPLSPQGKRVTVRKAISRLISLRSGEYDPSDPLHVARDHQEIAIKRLKAIPKDGGSRFSLPKELQLPCHVGHKGHPDVYGRMKWDDVAPTLTTGCTDITRGRFAHPKDNRAITLREASLLQTFPKGYKFSGSDKDIAVQIGNAVPVKFIHAILPAIRAAI